MTTQQINRKYYEFAVYEDKDSLPVYRKRIENARKAARRYPEAVIYGIRELDSEEFVEAWS